MENFTFNGIGWLALRPGNGCLGCGNLARQEKEEED